MAVPDMARVQFGVVAEAGERAREALSANSAAMEKLIAGLKQNGVDGKDIQTAYSASSPAIPTRARAVPPSSTATGPSIRWRLPLRGSGQAWADPRPVWSRSA